MPRYLWRNTFTGILVGYTAFCVLCGGSGQDWQFLHGWMQLFAGFGAAVVVLTWPERLRLSNIALPIGLLASWSAIGLLQSIPLPFEIWQALPGRSFVIDGYDTIGVENPMSPISLDIESTLKTVGYSLPPLFILLLCARIGESRLHSVIPVLFVLLAFVSLFLGALQIFGSNSQAYYLYEFTNWGSPVGLFANANHQASFLMMMLPFAIYLLNSQGQNTADSDLNMGYSLLALGITGLVLIGVVATGSLAAYVTLPPILILAWFSKSLERNLRNSVWPSIGLVLVVLLGFGAVATSPLLSDLGVTNLSDDPTSRYSIWKVTFDAIKTYSFVGSGIGTFEVVIPSFEDPDIVTSTYIARAHNDYLQIIVEAGLFGVVIIGAGLAWASRHCVRVWVRRASDKSSSLKRLASLSVLVVLLHSVVEYPARTPSITALLAICIAIICIDKNTSGSTRASKETLNCKRISI